MTDSIRTPFGFAATTDDVIAGVDLTGRRALVTGAASGIGVETARALAQAGAEVTLAVRRPAAGEEVAAGIRRDTGNDRVLVRRLDLADQDSVRGFTADWQGPLHILVNNAGIMALPELERTREGWEMQFATNFMGHFALTVGLHDALAAADGARIVSVSSSGNLFSPVVFEDLHFDFRPYDPLLAYGQSKTADALLAVEATRRWAAEGIRANALNPGAIATGLQKHTGGLRSPKERHKTVRQGAATSVLLAASPLLEGVGGRYFEDGSEAATVTTRPADHTGVAWYAMDPAIAGRLWDTALEFIG
ncbi:NAD(P)-dependent dehydrogenase, short-chain alcohol dehydrogenase family [Streptomyces sp. DvalAA-14]|uniref:SDR family NAD(P)-dependent oxidoreductase n=1 Tax=unclassified Streptomyces TaxID=2593676 RepID=UPI00081B35EF|nr:MULTISPECIES: SDR family NAD(P)-dependent oxidoreductase [unclassified Streptomyces]MYS22282.1 SDR family NAD(P)-dependent oxidoreductase [Streptomyces sp. SID4948]SCE12803.1 NAD(P)-dependent dehydrogenase, short-chain alcohol dehydrogenase family [Streptomyces sp. DvalAA-14]